MSVSGEYLYLFRAQANTADVLRGELQLQSPGRIQEIRTGMARLKRSLSTTISQSPASLASFKGLYRVICRGKTGEEMLGNLESLEQLEAVNTVDSVKEGDCTVTSTSNFLLRYEQSVRKSELENMPFQAGVQDVCWLTQAVSEILREKLANPSLGDGVNKLATTTATSDAKLNSETNSKKPLHPKETSSSLISENSQNLLVLDSPVSTTAGTPTTTSFPAGLSTGSLGLSGSLGRSPSETCQQRERKYDALAQAAQRQIIDVTGERTTTSLTTGTVHIVKDFTESLPGSNLKSQYDSEAALPSTPRVFTIIDYSQELILAEEINPRVEIARNSRSLRPSKPLPLPWDSFYTNWCRSGKPFSFSSGIDPHIAVAGLNLGLAAAYCWVMDNHDGDNKTGSKRSSKHVEALRKLFQCSAQIGAKKDDCEDAKQRFGMPKEVVVSADSSKEKPVSEADEADSDSAQLPPLDQMISLLHEKLNIGSGSTSSATTASGPSLLDACCGSGTIPAVARKLNGFSSIVTVDMRADFLERSRENWEFMEKLDSSSHGNTKFNTVAVPTDTETVTSPAVSNSTAVTEDSDSDSQGPTPRFGLRKQNNGEKAESTGSGSATAASGSSTRSIPIAAVEHEWGAASDSNESESIVSNVSYSKSNPVSSLPPASPYLVFCNTPWGHRFGAKDGNDAANVVRGVLDATLRKDGESDDLSDRKPLAFTFLLPKPPKVNAPASSRNQPGSKAAAGMQVDCVAIVRERCDVVGEFEMGTPAVMVVAVPRRAPSTNC